MGFKVFKFHVSTYKFIWIDVTKRYQNFNYFDLKFRDICNICCRTAYELVVVHAKHLIESLLTKKIILMVSIFIRKSHACQCIDERQIACYHSLSVIKFHFMWKPRNKEDVVSQSYWAHLNYTLLKCLTNIKLLTTHWIHAFLVLKNNVGIYFVIGFMCITFGSASEPKHKTLRQNHNKWNILSGI